MKIHGRFLNTPVVLKRVRKGSSINGIRKKLPIFIIIIIIVFFYSTTLKSRTVRIEVILLPPLWQLLPLVALSVISAFWRTSTSSSVFDFDFDMSALFKWYPFQSFPRNRCIRFGISFEVYRSSFQIKWALENVCIYVLYCYICVICMYCFVCVAVHTYQFSTPSF